MKDQINEKSNCLCEGQDYFCIIIPSHFIVPRSFFIQYPPPYIDFLSLFSFIELDLFTVAKMDCAISGGFLSKLLFSTILPIGISLLFVFWLDYFKNQA